MELFEMTALELGARIRAREVGVVEATRACLDRIGEKDEGETCLKQPRSEEGSPRDNVPRAGSGARPQRNPVPRRSTRRKLQV